MKRFILRAFARALDSIGAVGRILTGQPPGPGVTLFGYWRMMRNSEPVRRFPDAAGDSVPGAARRRSPGHGSSPGPGR
jgi:hypothetical protein